jgi:hypothetical protein
MESEKGISKTLKSFLLLCQTSSNGTLCFKLEFGDDSCNPVQLCGKRNPNQRDGHQEGGEGEKGEPNKWERNTQNKGNRKYDTDDVLDSVSYFGDSCDLYGVI